jgi:hypothetical protein
LGNSDIGIIASEEFDVRKALPPAERTMHRVVSEVNSISLPDKKRLHDIGEFNEILANSWQSYDFVIFRIYLDDEWQSICDAASNDFVTTYSAIAVGMPGDRHPYCDSLVCKPLKVRG